MKTILLKIHVLSPLLGAVGTGIILAVCYNYKGSGSFGFTLFALWALISWPGQLLDLFGFTWYVEAHQSGLSDKQIFQIIFLVLINSFICFLIAATLGYLCGIASRLLRMMPRRKHSEPLPYTG